MMQKMMDFHLGIFSIGICHSSLLLLSKLNYGLKTQLIYG
ncbi:hypothetical protein LX73_0811 [Fodinibius salinus]|uniref:Uncharacterized protein n=1 Tax=Fodinibius salinus TaxID=860790 RepID=A0A5D3YNQ2_9BACT|nr:hypothetical protein LX73_0811 [Fodinibius salinus]